VERLFQLAIVGFLFVASAMLKVAWQHHLYLAVFLGAASTVAILMAGYCLWVKERIPALGFFDLGFLFGSVAAISVALHHGWIIESIIGGMGLVCLFVFVVYIEIHPKDAEKRG